MRRAAGGPSPIRDDRRERVRGTLSMLERVPVPRRFYVALASGAEEQADERYPADYPVSMARRVPQRSRMDAVRGGRWVDASDLPAGFGADFLLDHAVELFQASDAERLMAMAGDGRAGSAAYGVAAARPRPADADGILGRAMDR